MTPLGVPTQGRVGWPKKRPLCPLSHRPGGLQEEQRRSAFTGPVRAASGAWRRPGRPQGLPRAGRTARTRGRGRFGAPPAHAAPGEGSARGAGPPTCLPSGTPDWCRNNRPESGGAAARISRVSAGRHWEKRVPISYCSPEEEKHRAGRLDKTRVASTRPRKRMPPPPPPPRRATGRSANRSAGSFLPYNLRRHLAGYCLVGGRREQHDVRKSPSL